MIRPNVPGRAVSVSSQLLACNVLTSIAGSAASLWPPTRKLPLPLPAAGHARRDLVPVNVKPPRQHGLHFRALNGSQGHLHVEGRAVVPASFASSSYLLSGGHAGRLRQDFT
jgi:hypothetical protein